MNVRVIAGKYGGRVLDAPGRDSTHAMGERIRNALFNSIGTEVQNATVLDAFAGSGAVGIEALSRGARQVTFIERDRIAAKVIEKNLTLLGAGDSGKVIKATVHNWLETAGAPRFDLIFADPPYHDEQFSTISRLFGLLKPGALMVVSHSGRGEVPIQNNRIVVVDNRSYGNAYLTFFRLDA